MTGDRPAGYADFVAAQKAAALGVGACRACKRVSVLETQVTVRYGGGVAMVVCPECLGKVDAIISRDGEGIRVALKLKTGLITLT